MVDDIFLTLAQSCLHELEVDRRILFTTRLELDYADAIAFCEGAVFISLYNPTAVILLFTLNYHSCSGMVLS
jgi:hypothetical protein